MISMRENFFVISSIILSGSLIPFILSNGLMYWLFILLSIAVFDLLWREVKVSRTAFTYCLLLISFIILTCVVRFDFEAIVQYFGVATRILLGLIICSLIPFRRFCFVYVQFFFIYACISLVLYGLGVLAPDYLSFLPKVHNDAGTGYRHTIIYFYQGIDSWNLRNAGLFWEGGAYASFLFFALLMALHLSFSKRKILIIFIAIASTGSTTGIFASILILSFSKIISTKYKLLIMLAPIILYPFLSDIYYSIFISKFSKENISFIDRSVGMMADLNIFLSNPIIGAGFSMYNENFPKIAISLGAFVPTSSNSFTGLLALFGSVYSVAIFAPILCQIYRISHQKLNPFIAMLASAIIYSSQGLVNFPLSYILMFYGIYNLAQRRIHDELEFNKSPIGLNKPSNKPDQI